MQDTLSTLRIHHSILRLLRDRTFQGKRVQAKKGFFIPRLRLQIPSSIFLARAKSSGEGNACEHARGEIWQSSVEE